MPDAKAPMVILDGYAYRLSPDGRLEHIIEARSRIADRAWVRVTESTWQSHRAAAALAVLAGGVTTMDGVSMSVPFYIATGREEEMAAAQRRRQESARDRERMAAKHGTGQPDAPAIAAAKGLKLWNGGMEPRFIGHDEANRLGLRFNESVSVYSCAKSRAELERMLAAYHGGEMLPGEKNRIRHYWSEGAWGVDMAGIEPEPGIWVQIRQEKPYRVWPKEKALG